MAFSIDEKLLGNKVKTRDGKEIGKVARVTPEDIVVREGGALQKKIHYLIPKDSIESIDASDEMITLKLGQPEVERLEVDVIEGKEEEDINRQGVGGTRPPDVPRPPTLLVKVGKKISSHYMAIVTAHFRLYLL